MDKRKVIEIVKRYINFLIRKKYDIKSAYLFGSYAIGNQTETSDVDLALVIADAQVDFDMEVDLMVLRRDFELSIEPHPFDERDFNSDHPLAYEILKTGVKIM